jgi:hypothetical protein
MSAGYKNPQLKPLCHRLLDRVRAIPRVTAAALGGCDPVSSCQVISVIHILDGRAAPDCEFKKTRSALDTFRQ